jgi:Lar family restriction alleviation protein
MKQTSNADAGAVKLLPCPFCGSTNCSLSMRVGAWKFAYCPDCLTEGPAMDNDSDAISTWNRRARTAEQAEGILAYPQYGRALDSIETLLRDAMRYRKLRDADINAIHKGGVFAGLTPDNVVINGADLDIAVDLLIDSPAASTGDQV